jgi:hypothetical protein
MLDVVSEKKNPPFMVLNSRFLPNNMTSYLLYKAPFIHRKTYNQQPGILGHTETSIFSSDRLRHVIVNPGDYCVAAANLRTCYCYIPTNSNSAVLLIGALDYSIFLDGTDVAQLYLTSMHITNYHNDEVKVKVQ